jgi:hypothetical protein
LGHEPAGYHDNSDTLFAVGSLLATYKVKKVGKKYNIS